MSDCVFCSIYNAQKEKIIAGNGLAFAIYDNFPVNEGYALIISKRNFDNVHYTI